MPRACGDPNSTPAPTSGCSFSAAATPAHRGLKAPWVPKAPALTHKECVPLAIIIKFTFRFCRKRAVVLAMWIYVKIHVCTAAEGRGSRSRSWSQRWCSLTQCGCWEPNSGPLQEQCVLLTSVAFPVPKTLSKNNEKISPQK